MAKMNRFEKLFVNSRLQYYFHRWFGLGKFLKKIPKSSPNTILEIGAGVGITSEILAQHYPNAQILATDFDEESIEIAKRKAFLKKVSFERADATKLQFASQSFDAIFSVLVLHHIVNFQDAISELARVLKPGGNFYLIDVPLKGFNPFHHWWSQKGLGIFSKQDTVKLLEQNGFDVKDYGGNFVFSLVGHKL